MSTAPVWLLHERRYPYKTAIFATRALVSEYLQSVSSPSSYGVAEHPVDGRLRHAEGWTSGRKFLDGKAPDWRPPHG